jgi:hypothetical protein
MLGLDGPVSPDSPSLGPELGKSGPNLSEATRRISLRRGDPGAPSRFRRCLRRNPGSQPPWDWIFLCFERAPEMTKKTQWVDCRSAAGAKPLRVIVPHTRFFFLRNASNMPLNLQSALIWR